MNQCTGQEMLGSIADENWIPHQTYSCPRLSAIVPQTMMSEVYPEGQVTSTTCCCHVEVAARCCTGLNPLCWSRIRLNRDDSDPSWRLWNNDCYRSYRK